MVLGTAKQLEQRPLEGYEFVCSFWINLHASTRIKGKVLKPFLRWHRVVNPEPLTLACLRDCISNPKFLVFVLLPVC